MGRGNSRLMAWEGERTVTFTMEDALISPEGFMILSGAGLVEANGKDTIKQHITETIDANSSKFSLDGDGGAEIELANIPYVGPQTDGDFIFVMLVKDGEIISEPIIPDHGNVKGKVITIQNGSRFNHIAQNHKDIEDGCYAEAEECLGYQLVDVDAADEDKVESVHKDCAHAPMEAGNALLGLAFDSVIVDYYTERKSGAKQIEITPDKFGGNYYLEAATLFRNQNGVDMPAEFIIPNCKIQSNFTFTMASTGDPSTFTFTMDAFPDYTRFDHSKKVLAAIQIIESGSASNDLYRHSTVHEAAHDELVF